LLNRDTTGARRTIMTLRASRSKVATSDGRDVQEILTGPRLS
jgi:hypothetical protein